MVFFTQPTGGPGQGIFPDTVRSKCINAIATTALTNGAVVQLDLAASATTIATNAAASYTPGGVTSVFRNVVAPTAVGIKNGILGVVTEPGGIATGAEGEVTFLGILTGNVIQGSGSVDPGGALVADTTRRLDATQATDEKIIGIYIDAQAATLSVAAQKRVLFNGITGFGMDTA